MIVTIFRCGPANLYTKVASPLSVKYLLSFWILRGFLQSMDVSIRDTGPLFEILDDGDGLITITEFCKGLLQLCWQLLVIPGRKNKASKRWSKRNDTDHTLWNAWGRNCVFFGCCSQLCKSIVSNLQLPDHCLAAKPRGLCRRCNWYVLIEFKGPQSSRSARPAIQNTGIYSQQK